MDEFESMGIFLGTNSVATQNKKYRTFEEAKHYAQSLKIKSQSEWETHTKTTDFPNDIPKQLPGRKYKKQWKGWPDFLGKKKKS